MAKKHSFAKGVATGVIGTAATVAGAVFAVTRRKEIGFHRRKP